MKNDELCSKCGKEIDHNNKNRAWCKSCKNEYDKQYMREYRDKKNPNRMKRSPRGQQTPLCSRCKKIKENINRAYCYECEKLKSKIWEKNRERPEGHYENYVKNKSKEWRRKNKDLVNKRVREDRKENPEKYKEYDKKWREENLEKSRYLDVLNKHKITSNEYEKLLSYSNNLCYICEKEETKKSRKNDDKCRLGIDHCHYCEKNGFKGIETIRGLLCHHCNVAIGSLRDNIELLERAIKYLKNHKHLK